MADAKKALRFTRVKLVNWRNFRNAEVRLGRRAFLVGPNASGKSNFLDALRFLRDIAKPAGGGLAAALAARNGLSAVRCLEARNPNYVELDVDVGDDSKPDAWGYRIRFVNAPREKFTTVLEEVVRLPDGSLIENKRENNTDDPFLFAQTKLEQVAQNKDFRNLAEFFASIRYLHVVPQIVREPKRSLLDLDDPYGGDLLRRMKDMPKNMREPRLRRIAAALQAAVPQFKDLELRDDSEGRPHLYASYAHWRPNASKQSEEVFSDGTLRLIGFLWSITEVGGPLLLEEPELSLHDAVASQIPTMMARSQKFTGRQVIATTHSYALLSGKGIGLDEVHRLDVKPTGTIIETASSNAIVRSQVTEADWSLAEAVLPLTAPASVNELAALDVARR